MRVPNVPFGIVNVSVISNVPTNSGSKLGGDEGVTAPDKESPPRTEKSRASTRIVDVGELVVLSSPTLIFYALAM